VLADGVGITIEGNSSSSIELAAPLLGVGAITAAGTYQQGIYGTPAGKTGYLNTTIGDSETTKLLDSSNLAATKDLKVYMKLKAIPGGALPLTLQFKWKKATVYPGTSGTFTDTFPMPDLSGLTDMLGGLKFASVPGYLYVGGMGPDTSATMSLSATKASDGRPDYLISGDSGSGAPTQMDKRLTISGATGSENENIKTYSDAISGQSATLKDMKGLLNGDYTDELKYSVTIASTPITNDRANKTKMISSDLLLVLPLYFEAKAEDIAKDIITVDGKKYVKVKVDMLEKMLDGLENDLLDSVRPTLDDFAKITKLNMDIKLENDISDDFYFGIETRGAWRTPLKLVDGETTSVSLGNSDINPELKLSFAVLVKEGDPDSNMGTLKLKPFGATAGLDIKITAGAKIDVDATL
jgi:hypothetical protein